jgi:hypothetical protein
MRKTYAYHRPSADGIEKIAKLRNAFSELHDLVDATCPEGRERSVALTSLEGAAMWAIKAVVCNDPESEAEYDVMKGPVPGPPNPPRPAQPRDVA